VTLAAASYGTARLPRRGTRSAYRFPLRPHPLRGRPHAARRRHPLLCRPPRLPLAAAAHLHRHQRRFTFSKLPAGQYVLCAQVSAAEAAPANSPWVDTCVWDSPQPPITLATGQQLAGIVFTAPQGAWLQVRVTDPDHVLPPVAANGPALLEPQLQLLLRGPDALIRHARFVSADTAAGLTRSRYR